MNPDATMSPTEPIPATPPSVLSKIFIGKDGLRAGWSLLVFIAMLAIILSAAHFVSRKIHPQAPNIEQIASNVPIMLMLLNESIPLVAVLLVTWIMSKIERRPNSVYGLGGSSKVAHFFAGLGWGVVCLSLLVLTLRKTGLLVIDGRLLFGGDVLRYGAMWLLGFLLVGLLEEYLTRGYIQYTLTRGLAGIYRWAFKTSHSEAFGFWTSAVILSILFGLGHSKNPGESPIGLLSAGLASMVFCLSLWRTGSLWWAIGFHTAWDWSQSFLYGVSDSGTMIQHHLLATHPVGKPILSGGATGPEGSIFTVAIIGLITLIIFLTLPRARYGDMSECSTQLHAGED
ncbi:MAG: CPBP family intramembrane glutamic endopeptidase [Terriglobales bacterium]|jgi:membrane protease YdiL (CAAX protease family)